MRVHIYDCDNTILPCDVVYNDCKADFGAFLHDLIPTVSPAEAAARVARCNEAMVRAGAGYAKERFPTSMVRALEAIAAEQGHSIRDADREAAYQFGTRIFTQPYDLYPGVRDMLLAYRDAGVLMGLCTKGDPAIQNPLKIDHNGLREIFGKHIYIWEQKKGAEEIRQTAQQMGVRLGDEAYMIGDSPREDILGGQAAGLKTVLIDNVVHAWNVNEVADAIYPDFVIAHVTDLPTVLPI